MDSRKLQLGRKLEKVRQLGANRDVFPNMLLSRFLIWMRKFSMPEPVLHAFVELSPPDPRGTPHIVKGRHSGWAVKVLVSSYDLECRLHQCEQRSALRPFPER